MGKNWNTPSRKSICNTSPSTLAGFWRRDNKITKMLIFPIDVLFESKGMIHLKESIRSCTLLPERAIAQHAANKNGVLYCTQTSHGVAVQHTNSVLSYTHKCHRRVHRYKPNCWYGITPIAPRIFKVPNQFVAVGAWN